MRRSGPDAARSAVVLRKIPAVDARGTEGRDQSSTPSQQIRPLLAEVERYGPYSRAGEFVYDRPFLWGSKRTGPDLHRIGGKYSDEWHRLHMINPRDVVPRSIMPAYPWLAEREVNAGGDIGKRLAALRKLGHPYDDEDIANADVSLENKTELDAVVAYLQKLGTAFSHGDKP